jgi:hypothetical protein
MNNSTQRQGHCKLTRKLRILVNSRSADAIDTLAAGSDDGFIGPIQGLPCSTVAMRSPNQPWSESAAEIPDFSKPWPASPIDSGAAESSLSWQAITPQ